MENKTLTFDKKELKVKSKLTEEEIRESAYYSLMVDIVLSTRYIKDMAVLVSCKDRTKAYVH